MKRLLAYLFIVLGLGLTFNANANVIIEKFIMEFENLDKQFDKLYNGHEEFNYATKSEDFNIEKCNLYLSKIEKQSSTVNKSLALIKEMQKDGIGEQINEEVLTRYLLKLSEYEDQFNKVKNNKFDCNDVKTAKAEPSQTQKVSADDYPYGLSKNKQYKYTTQFLKDGDYNGAEKAFKKFLEINPNHKLSGSAQYWLAETFRVRQLYTDAAENYLIGYQKYPKSTKAPINLLKLGVSLVQIGDKDLGCKMIVGMVLQYPKASGSVKEKAKYEAQRFKCDKRDNNYLAKIPKLLKEYDLEAKKEPSQTQKVAKKKDYKKNLVFCINTGNPGANDVYIKQELEKNNHNKSEDICTRSQSLLIEIGFNKWKQRFKGSKTYIRNDNDSICVSPPYACDGLTRVKHTGENLYKDYKTQIAKAEPNQTQKVAKKISSSSFDLKAKSAILIDSNSNQVLYEKNADLKIYPASMTKIMTTLIAFDLIKKGELELNDKFIVSEKAWRLSTAGYSSMFIMVGDKISVENLLRGIIVASGNDACVTLAEGIAGSEENFVKLMNKKAKLIGLKNTNFANTTGINDPNNFSTVRDIANLSSYMIKNYPNLYKYYSEKKFTWNRTGGDPITQGNRNPLLYKSMLGVDGIKTGYLSAEKYQLASSMKLQNNERLIAVGSGFETKNARAKESAKLLLWAKLNYQKFQIAKEEPTIIPKKKVKVVKKEPKQEEFKPKKTNQDNEAPVIEIAEAITVNDSDYEFEGTVTDKSKQIFIEVDGRLVDVKKGKFTVKGYSPVDKEISIQAIDGYGNRSKPKIVKLIIDIKDTDIAEKLEPLNPSKIRAKVSKNRVALIIGIENYIEAPKANYANLDAKYFFDYARKGFGIKKQNINLLVDENATFVKTSKALTLWLKTKIKADQTDLVVFFAGHGLASNDGKELYLLPQDSDPNLLDITALSRTKLFQTIIDLKPKSVTMFLDTCYSGVSRDEQMLLASARPIRIVADEQEGIPDNFTIFTASQVEQISSGLKEANHGIFSYYLMKGLEGKADSNQDKKITNGELLAYMDENVSQKAAELGRPQNPSLAGDPDKVLMSYR